MLCLTYGKYTWIAATLKQIADYANETIEKDELMDRLNDVYLVTLLNAHVGGIRASSTQSSAGENEQMWRSGRIANVTPELLKLQNRCLGWQRVHVDFDWGPPHHNDIEVIIMQAKQRYGPKLRTINGCVVFVDGNVDADSW